MRERKELLSRKLLRVDRFELKPRVGEGKAGQAEKRAGYDRGKLRL